jgi:hypothetical protein
VFEGEEQVIVDARGFARSHVLKKPVVADFQQGGILDYEIEAALEFFNFSGLPDGVNPLTRIAAFDTEAYVQRLPRDQRDEMYVQINERLRELQALHPSEFIIVEPPRKAAPWPSYDQDSVEDVLKFQERLRFPAEEIRLYESENRNREAVVSAMLEIEDPDGNWREAAPQEQYPETLAEAEAALAATGPKVSEGLVEGGEDGEEIVVQG